MWKFLADVLEFYRIKDWIKNLGICILGLILPFHLNIKVYMYTLASVGFALAHVFSINDYFDFKLNGETNYISKKIKKGYTGKKILLLIIFPLFGILLLSLFLPFVCSILVFFFVFLFDLYSCPPLRLKRYWFFSLSINSFCLGVLLLLIGYFSISNTLDSRILTFTVIFSSYIFFTELIHQISHRRRDMKAGIKSFPNTYGIKNSLKACQVIQLLPIFIATYLLVSDFYSNFVFIGTIIFSLLRILKVQTLNLRTTSFSKLRNRMYGSHEGLYYLALLTILKIYQHV